MELEPLRIFVKVIELGSFTRAAAVLNLPKSTVSRAVSRLEHQAHARLLLRTTRSLSLTAPGRAFYESCRDPIRALEEARRTLDGVDARISGVVRLTAVDDLGVQVISPAMGRLISRHPELSFEFSFTDELVDLVREGFDLAIRVGKLNPSSFRARKLGEIALIPVAAPAYLARKPEIREPADLSEHDSLAFPGLALPRWTLCSGARTVSIPLRARALGNHMASLVELAANGAGVALVPAFLCKEKLESGELVRVLPRWSARGLPVSLVIPGAAEIPARIRLVAETLADELREVLRSALDLPSTGASKSSRHRRGRLG
ncbi:MAG: LysR family transcriptional regulator [Oligoflexia bacterium]|nr:LysR family transcriptional regulator [Oligoflexia bacterium]